MPHSHSNKPTSFWTKPRHPLRFFATVGLGTLWLVLVPGIAAATIFSAVIVNDVNFFSSGTLVLDGVSGSDTCSSGAVSVSLDVATCSGTSLPSTTLSTSTTSATITLSQVGSLSPSVSRLSMSTCGIQQASTSVGTDTALAYGNISYQAAGPLGGKAVTLTSSSGSFDTLNSSTGPATFTQVAWFKTTTSGSILSFANTYASSGVASWDRMIWIDATGHVVAGVYPNAVKELKSIGTYNDGAWHFVAVTLSSTAGFSLYVDNAPAVSSSSVTSAQAYSGYWHIGWSNAPSGWTDPPTNNFFVGSLAGIGVLPTALTGSAISALYASATLSAYSSAVDGHSPTAYWSLGDSGNVAYVGAVPGVTSACALAQLTVQSSLGATTTCVAPVSAGACAAPSSVQTAAAPFNAVIPNATLTNALTITVTMDVATGLVVNAAGLRLLVPFTFSETSNAFSATLSYAYQAVIL